MPELYVAHAKIQSLKADEHILGWDGDVPSDAPTGVLLEIEAKRDYTYFRLTDKAKQFRLHNDAVAHVQRQRATPEEQAAYRKQRALEELDAYEAVAVRRYAESREEITARLAAGQRINSFEYSRLLHAEANSSLYEDLMEYHKRVSLRLAFDGPIERKGEIIEEFTRFDAMIEVRERCLKQLIDNAQYTNHSSGSGIDALLKSYQHQAMADFVHESRSPFGHFHYED